MADITYTHIPSHGFLSRIRKTFSAIGARIVDARMREAERHVAYHLLALDDRTLGELGFDRAELLRKNPLPGLR